MDGNGRWAKKRGKARSKGHEAGVEALRRTVEAAGDLGLRHLTVYAFSTENWTRPAREINFLMSLLRLYVQRDVARLDREGVRVRMIGRRDDLTPDILKLISNAEDRTKGNDALNLNIAFNYGGRAEIIHAAKSLAADCASGVLQPDDITDEMLSDRVFTAGQPDPDLIIRTSGEIRLSNFLLWQSAYAELLFLDIFWPEFGRAHLKHAIEVFNNRSRRYGGLSTDVG